MDKTNKIDQHLDKLSLLDLSNQIKQDTQSSPLFEILNSKEIESFGSDEWLTTDEAAAFIKVSAYSLRNMSSNGFVPYHKLQSRNRYRKSDLIKLLTTTRMGGFRGL